MGFLQTTEDSQGPAVAWTGATHYFFSSSFLYGDEVTITEVSALRFRFVFGCLTGSGERARIMPTVFTTAMTSAFPGLGAGPGVQDLVGHSVASPFLEPDVIPGLGVGPAYISSLVQLQVGQRVPSPALCPNRGGALCLNGRHIIKCAEILKF